MGGARKATLPSPFSPRPYRKGLGTKLDWIWIGNAMISRSIRVTYECGVHCEKFEEVESVVLVCAYVLFHCFLSYMP